MHGMSHRCTECRYLCSELVSVHYEDGFNNIQQAVGNLEEIASTEAILLMEERLEPGLPISFRAKGHDLQGVVGSSDFDETLGWFIKVELDFTSRWHGRMFVPEHFLALCEPPFSQETEAVALSA
jgi:hypothetical protein